MPNTDLTHQPCPDCGSSDALTEYADGHSHCFSCGRTNGAAKDPLFVLPDLFITAIKSRKITKDVASRFRVGVDKVSRLLYFPYFRDGVLVGAKSRTVDKQFRWHGQNNNVPLFGMQTVTGKKHLIITEGECLRGEAEVLTERGFCRLNHLEPDDKVAQWDNGKLEFVHPIAYIKKEYTGPLLHSYNRQRYSITTTPEHGFIQRQTTTDTYVKSPANNLIKHGNIPRVGVLDGPGLPYTPLELSLIIAWAADGHIGYRGRVAFKKARKLQRFSSILETLGLDYKTSYCADGNLYISFEWPDRLPQTKHFPEEWLSQASKEQREFMLSELMHWDGNLVPNRQQTEYSNKHLHNAQWVQALAHTTGMVSTVMRRSNAFGSWYKVSVLHNKTETSAQTSLKQEEVEHSGFVYCVQVPSGAFLVRDDGCISITGNCDALSAYQMTGYSSVSLPFGAQSASKYLKAHMQWIESFENIYICFDEDEAGRQAAQAAREILKPGRIRLVYLPAGYKDASDMLQAGKTEEFRKCIWGSEVELPSGFIKKEKLKQQVMDYYYSQKKKVGHPTGFTGLDSLIGGWRPGEVTILTSGTGVGKSTFARQLTYELAKEGVKSFFIPLEQSASQTTLLFSSLCLSQDMVTTAHNINKDTLSTTLDTVLESTTIYEHFGNLSIKKLLGSIEYAVRSEGAEFIVLDHLNAAIGSCDDERKALDSCMSELKSLSLGLNVHILVIAHQSRDTSDRDDTKPTISRIRGSAGVAQYADCALGLFRDRCSNTTTIQVLKASRSWGKYGEFTTVYNPDTTHTREVTDPDARQQNPESREEYHHAQEDTVQEVQTEQQDYQDQRTHIQEQGGTRSMGKEQALPDRVRDEDSTVPDKSELQTGLHPPERNDGGSERVPLSPDEEEVESYPDFGVGHQNPNRRYRNLAAFEDACRQSAIQDGGLEGTDSQVKPPRKTPSKRRSKKGGGVQVASEE